MSSDVLLEELEVLESIYPTELSNATPETKERSDRQIQIDVEPDDPVDGVDELNLTLNLEYPDGYPDVIPELSLEATEGKVNNEEVASLLDGLRTACEENLGMAMTFTLVTHIREQLSAVAKSRTEARRRAEMERQQREIEAEEAKTRGTSVTVQSFRAWKIRFDQELAAKKAAEDEAAMKAMTPKEREEFKRLASRLTGRQLFERNQNIDEGNLLEEGTVSVDISQFERARQDEQEEEGDHITFSDSD